jgi:hypothetical protein
MPKIQLHFRINKTHNYDSDESEYSDSDDSESGSESETIDEAIQNLYIKESTSQIPDLTTLNTYTPENLLYGCIDYIEKYYNIVNKKWISLGVIEIKYTIKDEFRKNGLMYKKKIYDDFMEHSYADIEYGSIVNNGWVWYDSTRKEIALTTLFDVKFFTDKNVEVIIDKN